MWHRRQKLRFKCTGCGTCCTGGSNDEHYIAVSAREQDRIRSHLGVSRPWFRRRYVIKVDAAIEGIRLEASGRCAFLDLANRCRIYPVRPQQCRTYPFWPEALASPSSWQAEGCCCEGIGRGSIIPRIRIEKALRNPG
ncbi:MAG: YkgJ family cysteine cluster protein [Acidiferrobacterales bacterium]